MNSITRKLVLSVLTVVLTVIALGTTTFAWFTLTNTSVIQPFQAQVVSDTGIEVAVGDVGSDPIADLVWKTVITTQDIYDYIEATYDSGNENPLWAPDGTREFRFTHVTTPNGYDFYDLNGLSTTSGYLEIPLHFRSDNEQQIMWEAVTLASTPASYLTGVTFVDSSGSTRTAGGSFPANLADAMKISVTGIVNRTLSTPGTTAFENPAGGTNTLSGGYSNKDLRTNAGDGVAPYIGTDGAQNFYYVSTNTLPTGSASVNTVATLTALPANQLVLDMASGQTLIADAEYYGYVVVRVWFEGWDAEGYNALLGRMIEVSLRFGV